MVHEFSLKLNEMKNEKKWNEKWNEMNMKWMKNKFFSSVSAT